MNVKNLILVFVLIAGVTAFGYILIGKIHNPARVLAPPIPEAQVPVSQAPIILQGNRPTNSHKPPVPKSSHGMLFQPTDNRAVKKINIQRISQKLEILDEAYVNGRYSVAVVTDQNLLVLTTIKGIDIFNISNPGNLERIRTVNTPGSSWGVIEADGDLWVAEGYTGVTVIDGQSFKIKRHWKSLKNARSFCKTAQGDIVVCQHNKGAALIRPSSSEQPVVISQLPIEGKAFWACAAGQIVYLATMNGGYQAIDISTPERPVAIWAYTDLPKIVWCGYRDGYHYIINQKTGLTILKDQGKNQPQKMTEKNWKKETRSACFIGKQYLAVVREKYLTVLNISDPEKIFVCAEIPAEDQGRGIIFHEGSLIFSDGDWGVRTFKINDSGQLTETSHFENFSLVMDTVIKDDLIFTTCSRKGLYISRLLPDGKIQPVSHYPDLMYATGIDVSGSIAGVADYQSIQLISIDNPVRPERISQLKMPGNAVNLTISGHYIYVADWLEGVQIVDISDVRTPRIISNVKNEGWATDILVNGDYAYCCWVNGGLITLDVRDPENPVITSKDKTVRAPEGLSITGTTLYLADFNAGLTILSIEDPSKPKTICWYDLSVCKGTQTCGNRLMVSNYIYGIKLFDTSDPVNPVMIGELDTPGKAYEAQFASGNPDAVIIADWYSLLSVKISNDIGQSL